MASERIQKILAAAGYGSRRSCEELIRQRRVRVNGVTVELGARADPARDHIHVDKRRVRVESRQITVALYKPLGIITTLDDELGRKTVRDLVPLEAHLVPVGRLDADSEGLVLMSNNGDLVNRLTHPRFEHEKEYHVLVHGHPDEAALARWRRGVMLEDHQTLPAHVSLMRTEGDGAWLRIVMREGRKRQIRSVAALLGYPVRQLVRVRVGPIRLGSLKPGEWRYLEKRELEALKRLQGPAAARRPGPKAATRVARK
jgi:23S rRNA pseudouridine2605 synthase